MLLQEYAGMKEWLRTVLAELAGVAVVLGFAVAIGLGLLFLLWVTWYRERYAISFPEFLLALLSL